MEINRNTMKVWVIEALKELKGKGTILEICKVIWKNHEDEIKNSGDTFYTWQYEIRWAGDILRKEGVLKPTHESPRGLWQLGNVNG